MDKKATCGEKYMKGEDNELSSSVMKEEESTSVPDLDEPYDSTFSSANETVL